MILSFWQNIIVIIFREKVLKHIKYIFRIRKFLLGYWVGQKFVVDVFVLYLCKNFLLMSFNHFAAIWVWTYLLIKIFGIGLFQINFLYQHLLNIIKFRLFLKKCIVCNIFEKFKFRFDDEWFSKKSYIDIYSFDVRLNFWF